MFGDFFPHFFSSQLKVLFESDLIIKLPGVTKPLAKFIHIQLKVLFECDLIITLPAITQNVLERFIHKFGFRTSDCANLKKGFSQGLKEGKGKKLKCSIGSCIRIQRSPS